MLKRLLDEGHSPAAAYNGNQTDAITEIIFNGMLGASLSYSVDRSRDALDKAINALIDYLNNINTTI